MFLGVDYALGQHGFAQGIDQRLELHIGLPDPLRQCRASDGQAGTAKDLVLRGIRGKSELTVREIGRLAVTKRTNPYPLLPPCILLILLLSGQATRSSPVANPPMTPC